MNKFFNWLDLAFAYVRLNLRAQMEYRAAFISQLAAMAINDTVWVIFWAIFFSRFHALRGWTVQDVLTIWAISAAGFGVAAALFGNAFALPTLIMRGQLDAWLLYPRAALPHLILGKTVPSAWGDALFGYALYLVYVHPDLQHSLLFLFFTFTSAMLFAGFFILSGSLAFFIGNAETVAEQWRFSLITFSTYPATLFEGTVKLLLFSAVPAGFVSYLPVEVLHHFSWANTLCVVAGCASVLGLGIALFYTGLGRYESSSLMELRG